MDNQQTREIKSHVCDLSLDMTGDCMICAIERERDEARAAIPAGELVSYADHQKVHNAASRLLVAINKQLPIGSFSLISHEYHAVKDAIYGREGAQ
jgi:hypothetical protein